MKRIGIVVAVGLLGAGCYQSYQISGGADVSVDTVADTVTDTVVDTGVVEPMWVDRDDPDGLIQPELLFAAVPDVAWNGRRAGVVYHGLPSGSSNDAINFLPLGATGDVVGDEQRLFAGPGMAGSIPRIAATPGGDFLVSTLLESGGDHIAVLLIDENGETLARGDTPVDSGLLNPMAGPVQYDEYVYVACESYSWDVDTVMLYRFYYPGLEFDMSARIEPEENVGSDPVLIDGVGDAELLLFSRHPGLHNAGVIEINGALETMSGVTLLGTETPVNAFHAVSTREHWYSFVVRLDHDSPNLRLWVHNDESGLETLDVPAVMFGAWLDSSASTRPSWGTTFVAVDDLVPDVIAYVAAEVDGGDVLSEAMRVSDVGAGRITDMPFTSIAWTGNGFLVVWDDWREEYNYALVTSYVELVE